MTSLTRTEFAESRGWSRQYVSKLAKQGRLVLTADGKVDVDATNALLANSADPSKAGVAARHERERLQRDVHSQVSPQAEYLPASSPTVAGVLPDFQKARAHREYYLGQLAEAEFRKVQGSLVEKAAVEQAAFNAARLLRDLLLGLPKQLSAELAAINDPWELERRLTAGLRRVLEDAQRLSAADFLRVIGESELLDTAELIRILEDAELLNATDLLRVIEDSEVLRATNSPS